MESNDRLSCIGWLHDARVKINKEMAGMTPEERVAYIHKGAAEGRRHLPRFSPEEAKRRLRGILYPEEVRARPGKTKAKESQ